MIATETQLHRCARHHGLVVEQFGEPGWPWSLRTTFLALSLVLDEYAGEGS